MADCPYLSKNGSPICQKTDNFCPMILIMHEEVLPELYWEYCPDFEEVD